MAGFLTGEKSERRKRQSGARSYISTGMPEAMRSWTAKKDPPLEASRRGPTKKRISSLQENKLP